MDYETIAVEKSDIGIIITINRPQQRNSINNKLLEEINRVLDQVEEDERCRLVVLAGQPGTFCTGMDFEEFSSLKSQQGTAPLKTAPNPYMATLKRFTLIPRVVIAVVDGQVMAGGVGLAAASDLVIATPRSQFCLSEALWGLLPAMVTPFLVRRVGFQAAYRMTLTTAPVHSREALDMKLVDEISESPFDSVHRLWLRLSKLSVPTLRNLKEYFRKMWLINEAMENIAITEIERLSSDPRVIENISNYVKYGKFPWEGLA
ncbi:MAG: polyketide biosynthesis enoyl-CoA hydratase PksH [Acidobacteriota bacterium]|nr:polyketide biosynthesis enoyl-CoA hydratase PksH [Acidobacteriota bacterium]